MWLYKHTKVNQLRRFDPVAMVVRLHLRVVRGDREQMGCNAMLRATTATTSGYEIVLARGLSYQQQVYEIAHEIAEYILAWHGHRPELSDDLEAEALARASIETAAETLAMAIIMPRKMMTRLYAKHWWALAEYRKELLVAEWMIAIRLGNALHTPVAVLRGKATAAFPDVVRSDWWPGCVYDEQIVESIERRDHQVFELGDERGYVVLWHH